MSGSTELFPALGFLQFPIELGEPEKNLVQVRSGLESLRSVDGALIVLPEMWSTGFAYNRLTELAAGTAEILRQLADLAGQFHCILAGSLPELAVRGGKSYLYNTMHVVGPDGVYGTYRKQQVFSYGGEGKAFSAGFDPSPVDTPGGRIGCLVCYDLRFPDIARNQCQQGADLLICSAQWPAARREHWRTLLRARAIENQTFIVACNGCGTVDGVELGGFSAVIDPEGKVLFEAGSARSSVSLLPSWQVRDSFRSRFTSFAVASYPYDYKRKICQSAADCLKLVRSRKGIGQRLVYCVVGQAGAGPADLAALQDARRQGDFLLVGVQPAAIAVLENGEAGVGQAGDEGDPLSSLAALGCVDAVCSLRDFSAHDLASLGKLLSPVEAAQSQIV